MNGRPRLHVRLLKPHFPLPSPPPVWVAPPPPLPPATSTGCGGWLGHPLPRVADARAVTGVLQRRLLVVARLKRVVRA